MNTQVRSFLDALPVAAIVSNVKNNRIVYLNKAAKSCFKISEIDDKLTCQELLKLEGEDLKWYENVNLTSNIERFQVIYQNKNIPYPVLLDSSVLEYDGYQARLDVINTKNYDMIPDYNLYSNVFERSVNILEKLYNSDMGLEGNIYQILDLVLYAYGGDRASFMS